MQMKGMKKGINPLQTQFCCVIETRQVTVQKDVHLQCHNSVLTRNLSSGISNFTINRFCLGQKPIVKVLLYSNILTLYVPKVTNKTVLIVKQVLSTNYLRRCMEIVGENLCVDIGIEGLKSILETVQTLKASVSPCGVENDRCRFLDNTSNQLLLLKVSFAA